MNAVTETPNEYTGLTKKEMVALFSDDEVLDEYLTKIEKAAAETPFETGTKEGRAAIRTQADRMGRRKTALEAIGKEMNEERRRQIGLVDARRKKAETRLANLKVEIRKPLTEWETQQAARKASHQAVLDRLKAARHVSFAATSVSIEETIASIEAVSTTPADLDEFSQEGTEAKADALEALRSALVHVKEAEEAKAENARLKAEADALAAERKAQEQARAEEEAKRRAAEEAEERRKRQEEEAERIRQQAIADEREREARRREEEEARAQEAREREERAEEARKANVAHRQKVQDEIAAALIGLGVPKTRAPKLVETLVAGGVPHLQVNF